jgi:hypothetical protein
MSSIHQTLTWITNQGLQSVRPKLDGPVLIYGGPTTGKSYFQERLTGFRTLDTDDVIKDLFPEYFETTHTAEGWKKITDAVARETARRIRRDYVNVIFTNFHQPRIVRPILAAGVKVKVGFFRKNPLRIFRLSEQRGSSIDFHDAVRWVKHTKRIQGRYDFFHWLGDDEYISTILISL